MCTLYVDTYTGLLFLVICKVLAVWLYIYRCPNSPIYPSPHHTYTQLKVSDHGTPSRSTEHVMLMRVTRNSLAPRLFRVLPRQPSTAALDDLEADRHAYTTTSGNGTPSGADSFLEYHVTVNESDPVSTALLRVKPYTIRGFDTAHGPSTADYLLTADEQQGEPLPDVIYTLENHKKQLVISGVGARCSNGDVSWLWWWRW